MAKHNALQMFGRSGNPALSDSTFRSEGRAVGQTMTLQGTVNKTGILLGILVLTAVYTWNLFFQTGNPAAVMPIATGGAIGGFVLALITIFKKAWSPFTAAIYAALEGLFLGGISAIFEYQYPGIVIQATGLTLGTLASLLVLYKLGYQTHFVFDPYLF
jgi:uncharacterized YccA/Bax inhibitor family protein